MKRRGLILVLLGTVLLLAAVSLVLYNNAQDRSSGEYAQSALDAMLAGMPETSLATTATTSYQDDLYAPYETTTTTVPLDDTIVVDDRAYIGIIAVPSQNIQLPVLQEWSKSLLQYAPCRYNGSALDDSLIIAGHNYKTHFGRLFSVNQGDLITFTNVNGIVYQYEVLHCETLDGGDIEGMLKQEQGDWDLTLFTCTLSGQSRLTIRAQRLEDS